MENKKSDLWICNSVLAYVKSAPQTKKALVQWFPNQAIHENLLRMNIKIQISASYPRLTEYESVGVGPHHLFKRTDSNAVGLF